MIQSMTYDRTNRFEKRLVPDAMLDPNTGYGSRKTVPRGYCEIHSDGLKNN